MLLIPLLFSTMSVSFVAAADSVQQAVLAKITPPPCPPDGKAPIIQGLGTTRIIETITGLPPWSPPALLPEATVISPATTSLTGSVFTVTFQAVGPTPVSVACTFNTTDPCDAYSFDPYVTTKKYTIEQTYTTLVKVPIPPTPTNTTIFWTTSTVYEVMPSCEPTSPPGPIDPIDPIDPVDPIIPTANGTWTPYTTKGGRFSITLKTLQGGGIHVVDGGAHGNSREFRLTYDGEEVDGSQHKVSAPGTCVNPTFGDDCKERGGYASKYFGGGEHTLIIEYSSAVGDNFRVDGADGSGAYTIIEF